MAANMIPAIQLMATSTTTIYTPNTISRPCFAAHFGSQARGMTWEMTRPPARHEFSRNFGSDSWKSTRRDILAMSASSEKQQTLPGLSIDLRGKRAFIAGVADDNGYGWAVAKALAAAGAEIILGTWVPVIQIFESSFRRGKFDESRVLPDGSLMQIAKVYPLDAVYDCPEDVPEDVKKNKRYSDHSNWTVKEVAELVKRDFGTIDILVHSLAFAPEVLKPLLGTSRNGYLTAISASSYSFISLFKNFVPFMNSGGATVSLSYIASERAMPGYGGGMNSSKAALESDTRLLAFEAGRSYNIRVNTISAGPLKSRAAKATGIVEMMMEFSWENAPLQEDITADEVGHVAAFLVSPLASAITGSVIYADKGLNVMGVSVDSPTLEFLDVPRAKKNF